MRLVVSAEVEDSSWEAAEGRGLVGDALQAPTTREAIATATKVRWRRDMGDSSEGANSWR
jgi:hypothetical protein